MKKTIGTAYFNLMSLIPAFVIAVIAAAPVAWADGMPDDAPKPKKVRPVPQEAPRVVPQEPVIERKEITPVKETYSEELCEWKARLSPGVTVWFFDEENTLAGPALYGDIWRTDYPINFRVGVEGRHMNLGQESAEFAKEFTDKTTRVTFIRIPFAVEYMHSLSRETTLFLGGGPDILHTANDITETNVGMHLGARLHYGFTEHLGVAVEAGYMWGSVDGEGDDVVLDNAYITPTFAYTF